MYLLSGFVSVCKQSTPRAAYTDDVISACFFQELSISAEGARERERESKGISIRGSAAAASEPATYLLQLSCDAAVGRIVGLLSLPPNQTSVSSVLRKLQVPGKLAHPPLFCPLQQNTHQHTHGIDVQSDLPGVFRYKIPRMHSSILRESIPRFGGH